MMGILTKDAIFHTIQGEGVTAGDPSVFVRLSGCNLRCKWKRPDGSETICDTPYSSYQPDRVRMEVDEVVSKVLGIKCMSVVVTGGEPFVQEDFVNALLLRLWANGKHVTVETNGTLGFGLFESSKAGDGFISLSPKLYSAGATAEQRDAVIAAYEKLLHVRPFAPHQIKFVIPNEQAIEDAMHFVRVTGARIENVVFMPEGETSARVRQTSAWLVDRCRDMGIRFSDRLHIHLWEGIRGK